VKSTVIMRENLEEMNRRGVDTPVILGGAALTRGYVESDCRETFDGALYYAKDAFEGLDVMGRIMAGEERPAARSSKERKQTAAERALAASEAAARPGPEGPEPSVSRSEIPRDIDYPEPPFYGARVIEGIGMQTLLPFINEVALFQFQWGYRRKGKPQSEYKAFIDSHVRPIYHELAKRCEEESILDPKAAYGFWPCVPEGETLVLLDPDDHGREVARFTFPRQPGKKRLCISDFFQENGSPDVIALQVVTVGQDASEVARRWFAEDLYQDYLHLHGLSVEAAEGLAEYIHKQVRADLDIAGEDARQMQKLFKQGYRGSRFSFGYPACPNLADQEVLLDLLGADRIGIRMSDEHQLWPEQSTSALVCHHPSAKYFTI